MDSPYYWKQEQEWKKDKYARTSFHSAHYSSWWLSGFFFSRQNFRRLSSDQWLLPTSPKLGILLCSLDFLTLSALILEKKLICIICFLCKTITWVKIDSVHLIERPLPFPLKNIWKWWPQCNFALMPQIMLIYYLQPVDGCIVRCKLGGSCRLKRGAWTLFRKKSSVALDCKILVSQSCQEKRIYIFQVHKYFLSL